MRALDRDIRMIDYLREESEIAKEKDGTSVSITQLLERFLFPSATHGKKVYKLSVGEQSVCIYYVYSYTSQMFCC